MYPLEPTQARDGNDLIPKHGGYRNTKTWQLAELIYDVTARFCDRYVDRHNRTHDQMVQAARSGCQNLLEGSVDSATSKKSELKLTGIARGSLMELQRDFQKFLQHRGLPEWPPNHPALTRFKTLRCASLDQFRAWVADETRRAGGGGDTDTRTDTDSHGQTRTDTSRAIGCKRRRQSVAVGVGPCESVCPCHPVSPRDFPAVCAANGALSLLNLCIYLIGRQMKAQADAFEKQGGFTERLYRRRIQRRNREPG